MRNWLRTHPFVPLVIALIVSIVISNSFSIADKTGLEYLDNEKVTANGEVISDIVYYAQDKKHLDEEIARHDENSSGYFLLSLSEIYFNGVSNKVHHKVKVNFYDANIALQNGNVVRFTGKIKMLRAPTNPGQFDYAKHLKRQGIDLTISLSSKNDLEIIQKASIFNPRVVISKTRNRLKDIADSVFGQGGQEEAGFVNGLILGYREGINDEFTESLRRSGTAHLIAISGLHVLIFLWILGILLRLTKINIKLQYIILILFTIEYAILSGAPSSVMRATIMAVIVLLSHLVYRKHNTINTLAFSAFVILLFDNAQLFELGFQLTFVSILGLVYISPIFLKAMLSKEASQGNSIYIWLERKYLLHIFSFSLSVWLVNAPILYYNNNLCTPCIVISNLIITPIMIIQMILGFILLWLGHFSQALASMPAFLITTLYKILKNVSHIITSIPFSYFYMPNTPLLLIVLFYVLLVLWTIWLAINFSARKFALVILLVLLMPVAFFLKTKPDGLLVTMLDVGKGNCIYIELPDGRNLIYDVGSSTRREVGKSIAAPFLFSRGITRLTYLMLSHIDADHINGTKGLLETIKVSKLIVSKYFAEDKVGKTLLDFAKDKVDNIIIVEKQSNDVVTWLENEIAILGPPEWKKLGYKPLSNDTCVIASVLSKGVKVLLTGDMQDREIEELLSHNFDLHSTILTLPHHGKVMKSFKKLAEATKPCIGLISSLPYEEEHPKHRNPYFTSKEVIDEYKYLGSKVLITGDSGAIIIVCKNGAVKSIEEFKYAR